MNDIYIEGYSGVLTRYKNVLKYYFTSINNDTVLVSMEIAVSDTWAYYIQKQVNRKRKIIIK